MDLTSDPINSLESHINLLDYGAVHIVEEDKNYLKPGIKIKVKMMKESLETLNNLADKLEALVNDYYEVDLVRYMQSYRK